MARHWRIARTVVLATSLVAFFVGNGLYAYYGKTRPRAPSLEAGRVYALNDHGKYVFLTKGELELFIGMFVAFVLGILCVLAIHVFAGRKRVGGGDR
jgi:hypothetical protein